MTDSDAPRPARQTPASTRRELERLERDLDPTTPTQAEAHLERYRNFAWLMDESIKLPIVPFRIGLDSIVGLIPGAGDLVLGTMGTYALFVAWRLGAPAPGRRPHPARRHRVRDAARVVSPRSDRAAAAHAGPPGDELPATRLTQA